MESRFVQIFDYSILGDAVSTACADAADLSGANQRIGRIFADGEGFRQILDMEYQRKLLE